MTGDYNQRVSALCRRIDQALQRSRPVIDPARERAVQEARRMRRAGATLTVIARKFGVSTALASKWCQDIASGPLSTGGGSRFEGRGRAKVPPPALDAPQADTPGSNAIGTGASVPGDIAAADGMHA